MSSNDSHSTTNGAPWLLTGTSDHGADSAALDYLLPNGRRHRVFIDQSHNDSVMQANIGDALATFRRQRTAKK